MSLFSILKNIYYHPMNRHAKLAALRKFFKWQFGSRILAYPVVYPFVEGSVLITEKSMTGATGNIYNGLHEHNEMLFVLHFLRKDDRFVDIGANVGTYTILASYNCRAQTTSFEPVPDTFYKLKRNVLVNDISSLVHLHNKALGKEHKTLLFTGSLDAANHVLGPDEANMSNKAISVECVTLGSVLDNTPVLIKMDVEGFESEVIEGANNIFSSSTLKAIIIELNGLGLRYGFNEEDIHKKLVEFGFSPYQYDPFSRKIQSVNRWGNHNTIYIRDQEFVKDRIRTARKFKINNLEL